MLRRLVQRVLGAVRVAAGTRAARALSLTSVQDRSSDVSASQAAMLRRLPGKLQAAGIAVGFGGVVLVSLPSADEGGTGALGVALVLLATVCYGVAVNIAAPIQQTYGSLRVMARMLALASLWSAPYAATGLSASLPQRRGGPHARKNSGDLFRST